MNGYSQGRAGLSAPLRYADFLRGGRTQRPCNACSVARGFPFSRLQKQAFDALK